MLPIGTKVFHQGHGLGEVVAHNQITENNYFKEKPKEAAELANEAGLLSGILVSFYSGDIYPNVIQFDSGYKDVYADKEIEVIK